MGRPLDWRKHLNNRRVEGEGCSQKAMTRLDASAEALREASDQAPRTDGAVAAGGPGRQEEVLQVQRRLGSCQAARSVLVAPVCWAEDGFGMILSCWKLFFALFQREALLQKICS
jgi:hypothetical protein